MKMIQIPRGAWKPILQELGFVIREDGLICSHIPFPTDSKRDLLDENMTDEQKCPNCGKEHLTLR
jgi:hypothetical protein